MGAGFADTRVNHDQFHAALDCVLDNATGILLQPHLRNHRIGADQNPHIGIAKGLWPRNPAAMQRLRNELAWLVYGADRKETALKGAQCSQQGCAHGGTGRVGGQAVADNHRHCFRSMFGDDGAQLVTDLVDRLAGINRFVAAVSPAAQAVQQSFVGVMAFRQSAPLAAGVAAVELGMTVADNPYGLAILDGDFNGTVGRTDLAHANRSFHGFASSGSLLKLLCDVICGQSQCCGLVVPDQSFHRRLLSGQQYF